MAKPDHRAPIEPPADKAMIDPVSESDAMFHEKAVAKRVTGGFLGGFFRGALVLGLIAGAIAGVYAAAVTGAFASLGAGLGIVTVGGTAALLGGLLQGVREMSVQAGAAEGYRHGRAIGRVETAMMGQQMMMELEAVGQAMEQEAKAKAKEKKPMTFENLPNHPANQPKTDKVAVGAHSQQVLAQPQTGLQLGQA